MINQFIRPPSPGEVDAAIRIFCSQGDIAAGILVAVWQGEGGKVGFAAESGAEGADAEAGLVIVGVSDGRNRRCFQAFILSDQNAAMRFFRKLTRAKLQQRPDLQSVRAVIMFFVRQG